MLIDDRFADVGAVIGKLVASDDNDIPVPAFIHFILLLKRSCCAPFAVDPVSVDCLLLKEL